MDAARVLRPLDEARLDVDRLRDYQTPAELGAALAAVDGAVEQALRLLLREDRASPDDLRLSALSPADLPFDRLLEALRRRELISLALAAAAHHLNQAARRSEAQPQAADADTAVDAVDRLRREVAALADRPIREAAHAAVEGRALEEPARQVPAADDGASARTRWVIPAVAAAAMLAAVLLVLLARGDDAMGEGVAAFREGRAALAETRFREALEDEPENVDALLYLGRIYRRQERYDEAAAVLRRAASLAATDAHVRRELGYLFHDLGRFDSAREQLQLAVEYDPVESANWIGLVRALCAAGDPDAEEMLRRAPAEARAALGNEPCAAFGRPSPDRP